MVWSPIAGSRPATAGQEVTLRPFPSEDAFTGAFLPKMNSQDAVALCNLGANVSQLRLRPGFQSRNLAKVSMLECRANGARLAFAPSAIPQTVGRQRLLGRCISILFCFRAPVVERTKWGVDVQNCDNGRRDGLHYGSYRVSFTIQIATFHAAAREAASAAMDAASANTLSRLEAQISELNAVVRVLSTNPSLADFG